MAESREPGAPVPKDEIDPELVNLRPATKVGLLTGFSVVVFCAYLAVRLWPDVRFAGEGEARATTAAAIAAGEVAEESHVAAPVTLERAAAVRVRVSEARPGFRVVPVAGTGDRVWVVLDGDGWAAPRPEGSDVHTGRLRRLSSMPWEESFRARWRAEPAPRFVADLRRAEQPGTYTTITGETVTVAPDDHIEVVITDPDAAVIVGSFGARLPDAEAWSAALAAAGLVPEGATPLPPRLGDEAQAWFEVRKPGALAEAPRALERAGLWGARVEPVRTRHRAAWRDVGVGATLRLGDVELPWSAVDVVAIHAARPLPADPWLIVVGEAPEQLWYVRPLYGAVAVFGVLFLWALARTVRRDLLSAKAPTPVS